MIVSHVRDSTYWILKIIDVRNYSDAESKRVFDLLKAMLVVYFDNKKSPIKSGFLKKNIQKTSQDFPSTLRLTIEEMRLCKIRLLRVEALDLVIKVLKSQAPLKKVSNKDAGKEVEKNPS
ncbi:hypothetical protein J1N35_015780 [Gossypium stocksii]|uniref:Uncharacterized protein n=1 Tax=Gossypium stocksii TaxID=47602 RepID=A0A9D3VZ30_9ROSI|nr:hypothetical protein J1N35_015780 [Gossypium stocksii]